MSNFNAACIGKGVATATWIVDAHDHNRLMPIGMSGELLIEGPILARGYLNDDDKTAISFITNPSWATREESTGAPRRRFYKTRDLARYDSDGNILYSSCKDTQVKVRGQRIELGEVENHLRRVLPTAVDLVVELINPQNESAASILIAFICLGDILPGTDDYESLKDMSTATRQLLMQNFKDIPMKMSSLVPVYTIPTVFIPLKEMPRTSAKKADRRKLRELASGLSTIQLREFSVR